MNCYLIKLLHVKNWVYTCIENKTLMIYKWYPLTIGNIEEIVFKQYMKKNASFLIKLEDQQMVYYYILMYPKLRRYVLYPILYHIVKTILSFICII